MTKETHEFHCISMVHGIPHAAHRELLKMVHRPGFNLRKLASSVESADTAAEVHLSPLFVQQTLTRSLKLSWDRPCIHHCPPTNTS